MVTGFAYSHPDKFGQVCHSPSGPMSDDPSAKTEPGAAAPVDGLETLRRQIDGLDDQIVRMLNERAKLVVEIGHEKRASGEAIYAPHREAQVLARVQERNEGPLSNRTIEAMYRELMSGSFQLEKPLRIGFLGPEGSFSHLAARRHFGSSVDFEAVWAIRDVFREVARGHADYGLVPIENSTGGGIAETFDAFAERKYEVSVYAEALLAVRHHLIGFPDTPVRQILSNPEAFQQCRRFLGAQYAKVELVPVSSTSQAVIEVKNAGPGSGLCAVASSLAAELHGVPVLFEGIEDQSNNVTRFFVLGQHAAEPSGDDKTSIMLSISHRPGALVRALSVFDRAGINLAHLEKRPSRRENWTYTFFADVEAHRSERRLEEAFSELDTVCDDWALLGSYPRARRIL
jgi:chorismate mutase / prephenate dehydratase